MRMIDLTWGWSHSLKDYLLMFDLKDTDLQQPLLDVAAGASSFNAELTHHGYHVISVDPLYQTTPDAISTAVDVMQNQFEQRVLAYVDKFHWTRGNGPEDLLANQRDIAQSFIHDYAQGLLQGRYIDGALPQLPFSDYQFTMSLCANFIFDGPYQDQAFQLAAIKALTRVARETRIYPLLNAEGEICSHLGQLLLTLQAENYGVEVREVVFHVQKNGNAMLRVWPKECLL